MLILPLGLSACGGKEGRAADYMYRAQESFDQEDYVKSELDVKNALQIDPNNLSAVRLMANLAEKQDKGREMFQYLSRAVQMDPDDIESHIKLGRIYVAVKRPEEAQSHADSALGINPNDAGARILNATIMHRQGEVEEARSIANDVLVEEPRNVPALAFLASTYRESEPDRAMDLLDQAVNADPQNEGMRKVKIKMLESLGRMDQINQELEAAMVLFPDKNEYRYSLANLLNQQGKTADGEQILVNLIEADETDKTAKLFHAQYVGNNINPEAAEASLKTYIAADPEIFEFRFALGQVYVMTRQFEKAQGVYEDIVGLDARGPYGIDARTKLASLMLMNGDEASARDAIREVLADETANPEALLMRASLHLKDNNSSAAVSDLRSILRDNPTHQNARLMLAKSHVMAKENNLALEEYKRLVDAYPNNLEGGCDLATLLVQNQRWDEVRDLLEVGVQQAPQDMAMARMLIDTYMRQQEWELAEAQAQRIIDLDSDSAMGHYVLARIAQSQGEFKDSIGKFKKALALNPDAIESITGLIRSYVRADDTKGALRFLEQFSTANPDNAQAVTLWGEMLARDGQWKPARAKNEAALAINPAWLPAYRNLVGIELREGNLQAADGMVSRGLEQAPENADLMMIRASIYEQEARWSDAIGIYEVLLEKNNGLDIAANNYVALVADHRNDPATLDTAMRYAQRFVNNDNPIFQDTLGWLYYRMGDLDEAVELLEKAVSKAGTLPQLRYHLGMAYYKLDRLDEARRELEAAVQNDKAKYQGIDEARATLELL